MIRYPDVKPSIDDLFVLEAGTKKLDAEIIKRIHILYRLFQLGRKKYNKETRVLPGLNLFMD